MRRSVSPIAVLAIGVAIVCLSGCMEIQSQPSMRQAVTVLPAKSAPLRTFSQWLDEDQVAQMTSAQWAVVARRSSVVVLNSWNYRLIPVLKRANPHVKVWVYKNLSGIRSDDCVTSQGSCGGCHRGARDS